MNQIDEIKNYDNKQNFSIAKELLTWIFENIKFESTILEFGSGHATKILSKYYNVISIEENEEWVGHAENSRYIFAPKDDVWFSYDSWKDELPEKYDLILIDGPTGDQRVGFLKYLEHFNLEVPIIIDDTEREKDNKMSLELQKITNKKMSNYSTTSLKNFTVLI